MAGRVRADINVTPLVDIVLVLLIIFIVITPAVNDAVRLPIAKHSLKPEDDPSAKHLGLMYLAARDPQTKQVTGPSRVLVDDAKARDDHGNIPSFDLRDPESRGRLKALIARSVKAQGDRKVFVKADADLPFKYVDDLFQVCREGGASEASIVTREAKRED
ncbi:MAG TPA: biopolymer transporter ExbD [Holophaga sp.]|nr:biopolymer transporter ExbD [Holophaga sp.]